MVPKATALPLHPLPTMTDLDNIDGADRSSSDRARPTRPDNNRSSTDPSPSPSPSLLIQGYFKDKDNLKDWARPNSSSSSSSHRNRSPYSRSHLRSRSSSAVAGLPLMTRAHSMPSPYTPRPFADTPVRTRSPFAEEGAGIESIQEDSELDLRPRSQQNHLVQPTALRTVRVSSSGSSGGRRRPTSPLHHNTPPRPQTSPPLDRYNESFPLPQQTLHHHSSASSMTSFSSLNSTPTSARSRSPSISSLDTIEDEPEMEAIERLKEAAAAEEEGTRRGSFDGGARTAVGFGFSRGRSERKRWSVCGGERRGDLDLETIWED